MTKVGLGLRAAKTDVLQPICLRKVDGMRRAIHLTLQETKEKVWQGRVSEWVKETTVLTFRLFRSPAFPLHSFLGFFCTEGIDPAGQAIAVTLGGRAQKSLTISKAVKVTRFS
jgi:hypothetical protein